MTSTSCSFAVFSGGTAVNSFCKQLKFHPDDGGSTAEIVRVLGGPGIGDVRSRLVRLADDSSAEARAVQQLLGHRLPSDSKICSKAEWHDILEGSHFLWNDISEPYKETIRAFLIVFHSEILRRASFDFDYRNGSVGNFFFTAYIVIGARLFFNSLETAIFWFSRVSGIPNDTLVIPSTTSVHERICIAAELKNGTNIIGQHQISHPSPASSSPRTVIDKSFHSQLSSPISRLYYVNPDRQETSPPCNPKIISAINNYEKVVYGIGSLFTSIVPSLILPGVGECIANKKACKILLLNGGWDRETEGMSASDFVVAITNALNRKGSALKDSLSHPPSSYITHVFYPHNGSIPLDAAELQKHSIKLISVESYVSKEGGTCYNERAVCEKLCEIT